MGVCVSLSRPFLRAFFCLIDLFELFVLLRAASCVVRLPSLLLRRLTLSLICVTVVCEETMAVNLTGDSDEVSG